MRTKELYGPEIGFVLPDRATVHNLPKGLRKFIGRVAPRGRRVPDGMWRSAPLDDFAYEVYLTNQDDELWVRRANPRVFRLETHVPTGLRGGIERVTYSTNATGVGVRDFGQSGAALSIESSVPEEILSIHQQDDPKGFRDGLTLISAIMHEKLTRSDEFRSYYIAMLAGHTSMQG